jgi:uncharacterized protein (DUF697 family)
MTRKRLPKAITRTVAERHEADADEVTSREPARRRSEDAEPADAASNDMAAEAGDAAAPAPISGEVLPPEPGRKAPRNEQRRRAAEKVVDRYKVYAALGGLFPMPAINLAGLTAINMRMVKALCDLYERPFEGDQTRSIILSLVGGSVPNGIGVATASVVGLVLPVGAFIGLAAASASAAAMTRGIGRVFIEHFEIGGSPTAATPSARTRNEPRDR